MINFDGEWCAGSSTAMQEVRGSSRETGRSSEKLESEVELFREGAL